MTLLRFRRPDPEPTVTEALAAVEEPTDWADPNVEEAVRLGAALNEADQQRIRAEIAEEELAAANDEIEQYKAAVDARQDVIDELLAERDADLARLPTPWGAVRLTRRPVDAVLYEALRTELGIEPVEVAE